MLPTMMMIYEKEPCPICQPKAYPTPVKLLTAVIDKRLMWFHKHMGLFTVLELDFSHVTLKAVDSNPGPYVESRQVRSLVTGRITSCIYVISKPVHGMHDGKQTGNTSAPD